MGSIANKHKLVFVPSGERVSSYQLPELDLFSFPKSFCEKLVDVNSHIKSHVIIACMVGPKSFLAYSNRTLGSIVARKSVPNY